jgi:hypothetical protein
MGNPGGAMGGGMAKQLRLTTGWWWHKGRHNVIGVGQSNFWYFRLAFFILLSKLPPNPDFCYSFGFS